MQNILIQLVIGLVIIIAFFIYHKTMMKRKKKEIKNIMEENERLKIQISVLQKHTD